MSNDNYITPTELLDSVKKVMKGIDLDPASSEQANGFVKAKNFFDKKQDGSNKDWFGNVWVCPPSSRNNPGKFAENLNRNFREGNIESAMFLNDYSATNWYRKNIKPIATAICLPKRIKFINPSTLEPEKNVHRSQIITYIGKDTVAFMDNFRKYGMCCLVVN